LFKPIFDQIQKKNPEIYFIGIWGKDGLELEKTFYNPADVELELLGAVLADVVTKIDRIALSPSQYFIEYEFDKLKVAVLPLTKAHFFLVIASPQMPAGKLKFFYTLYKDQIISQL